jgi:hypothetical protein
LTGVPVPQGALTPEALRQAQDTVGTVYEPVRPENSKLFADLTFLSFLLMLDQYISPSSDTPW